jgi:DNA-binding HxlR family transcriptional regulator
MPKRAYGQYCGLARALDMVGERWGFLIIRDLLVRPRRYTDLRHGLPRIPTNILSARLRELEDAGIVRRTVLPRPSGSVVYELTEYGSQLEDIVLQLGRWGAQKLGEPASDEIVTVESMIMAMRSTFRPEAAKGLSATYELRMGPIVLHMRIKKGKLDVGEGPLEGADAVIEAGPAIKAILAGEISPADALANGSVHLTGDPNLLNRFAEVFRI